MPAFLCQLGITGYCLQILCDCEAEKTKLGALQTTISHVGCKKHGILLAVISCGMQGSDMLHCTNFAFGVRTKLVHEFTICTEEVGLSHQVCSWRGHSA